MLGILTSLHNGILSASLMFILFKQFSNISGDFPSFIYLIYYIKSSVQNNLVEALCKWLFLFNSSLFNCFSPVSIRFFLWSSLWKNRKHVAIGNWFTAMQQTHTHTNTVTGIQAYTLQVCKWQYIPYFLRWNFLIHFDHFARAPNEFAINFNNTLL